MPMGRGWCNGRKNDSGVWNKSGLHQSIEDGTIKVPENYSLLENHCNLPYVFLGNDAFALKTFMIKPYLQSDLTITKRIYNYRHSCAQRNSENLFGILTNRWRIFYTMIPLTSRCVVNIILSTLALHNMLLKSTSSRNMYRPTTLVDSFDDHGNLVAEDWRN